MNYIRMEFPSRSSNEGFARVAVACFASQMDPTLNELEDIKTAVSEAVTNAIVHAYPDSIGRVSLKVRICEGNVLEITVKDAGKGIPNVEKARQPMLIIGGTSLNVYPAAGLIRYYRGHKLVLINKSAVAADLNADLVIADPIGETLAQI